LHREKLPQQFFNAMNYPFQKPGGFFPGLGGELFYPP
jgi:hypothetical protein